MRQQDKRNIGEVELIDISRRPKAGNVVTTCVIEPVAAKKQERKSTLRNQRKQRRRERRRKCHRFLKCVVICIGTLWLLALVVCLIRQNGSGIATAVSQMWQQTFGDYEQGLPVEEFATHPEWTEDFLTKNEYSRPGYRLPKVTNIFVHYTANAGSSAAQNRSYFEQQKDTHERSVSSHFIIGYEGEILQCVPLDEVAYAVQTRNYDSISIECCHLEEDGSFTKATYDSLIELLAWLLEVYDLEAEDILRHYDCGGKKCPLYYTEHEDAWEQLKKDVDKL